MAQAILVALLLSWALSLVGLLCSVEQGCVAHTTHGIEVRNQGWDDFEQEMEQAFSKEERERLIASLYASDLDMVLRAEELEHEAALKS